MTAAYPLHWPDGWPRTPERQRKDRSSFATTFDKARRDLLKELRMLGATHVVISSWLPLRQDGQPRSDSARFRIDDPGIAVYFQLRGKPMVMARDAYWSVHDNLRSIGLAIAHLRGLDRHGGATMMERAFEGFQALPAPGDWRSVLGNCATVADANAAYRSLAMKAHQGGNADAELRRLNDAIANARKELPNA